MAVPVLSNVAPTASTVIEEDQPLSFDITSAPALIRQLVFVQFPGANIEEVIWDGTAFTSRYATSTRTAIAGGFRYLVLRTPVWPDSPELALYAVNSTPEELQTSWSYTLSQLPTYDPQNYALPSFSVGVPSSDTPLPYTAKDQDYFLRLADKALDRDYVAGLKAGEGYEVLQEQAAIFQRVSEAITNTANGMLAQSAQGGAYATGIVEFYRTAVIAADCTVKAGSVVSARGGRFFVTLNDVDFDAADLGPFDANVRAVFQDWQHNVTGQSITGSGYTIAGEIDTIVALVTDPPFADPNIKVRQITDVTGGRAPMLDLLAKGNGLERASGEGDESLAWRTRNLPDNLTPAAIQRNLSILLAPYQATWEMYETWDASFVGAYDLPMDTAEACVFILDDTAPRTFPALGWVPDDVEQWGTFYVNISQIQPIEDYGFCLDEPATTADMLISPVSRGRRAIAAYDMPDSSTFGAGDDLVGCLDGPDSGLVALMGAIWEMLTSHRAAGIVAGLEQEGS